MHGSNPISFSTTLLIFQPRATWATVISPDLPTALDARSVKKLPRFVFFRRSKSSITDRYTLDDLTLSSKLLLQTLVVPNHRLQALHQLLCLLHLSIVCENDSVLRMHVNPSAQHLSLANKR